MEGGNMRLRFLIPRVVTVVAVAGLVFANGSAGAATGAAKPKTGGTLTYLFNAEPPSMDPASGVREVPQISPAFWSAAIFDQLVYTNPKNLKTVPKIAQSLTTADKGLTW